MGEGCSETETERLGDAAALQDTFELLPSSACGLGGDGHWVTVPAGWCGSQALCGCGVSVHSPLQAKHMAEQMQAVLNVSASDPRYLPFPNTAFLFNT